MRHPDMKPPAAVAAAAAKGLELRRKFDRGGTDVGVRRAEQLSAGHEVSVEDVTAIVSYFARHAVDKQAKAHRWGDESDPSAGFIAWELWGGDAGQHWAGGLKDKLDGA
ncbi:MAG: hypothetical protein ACRYG4_15515 [Janthinobacterium lividum]